MDEQLVAEALQYKIEDLKGHIEKCRQNIKIFEDVIKKELDTIERDNQMINILELHQGKKQ